MSPLFFSFVEIFDGIAFCLTHPVKANCNNGSFLYYLRVHGTRMLRMLRML